MVRPLSLPDTMTRSLVLLLSVLLSPGALLAQNKPSTGGSRVEILNADSWEFDADLAPGAQRLKGNVRFRHEGALMTCDSAYLYDDQRVEAFSRVRINQGDTLFVAGDHLDYSGKERIAMLDGSVSLRNSDMELTTPALVHDMRSGISTYDQGGRIVQHEGGNSLRSRNGTYLSAERLFIFSRRVRVYHPERTIRCDTMHYTTDTEIARFFGPTTITQTKDSTVLTTRRGTYDTRNELARFTRRSSVRSKERLLEGDSLHYDRHSGLGLAWGNVVVTDTTSGMVALGHYGQHDERNDASIITGNAELRLRMGADTLFLHGDTLFTQQIVVTDSAGNSLEGKRIVSRRGVRFFKEDMQGVCDTLVYHGTDSLIRMYHRPVLWNGNDQITGDHIRITLRDGRAHRLYVEENAFMMSLVDSVHFDQVTGSMMTGFFADNELRRLLVEGNSRTVYFTREEKDGKEEMIGVNRADCSHIEMVMEDGKVSTVTFLEKPDAVLYPMDKVPPEELRMKGSNWRIEERPVDRHDIFRSVRPKKEPGTEAAVTDP